MLQVTKLYSYLAEWVEGFREAVIPADVIARAIAFAISRNPQRWM
ncbi:hypothetical protein [Nostoc sphaeroides]|nr:hypothetical protein [Nostoc sphaeroides]